MKRLLGLLLAVLLMVGLAPAAFTPAHADPVPGPRDAAPADEQPIVLEESNEIVKVIVMLKSQPQGMGDQAAGLAEVAAVVNRWEGKHGIHVRRQFGSLVRGFSASMPANMVARLAADPAVASVTKMAMFYPSMESAGDLTGSTQARKTYHVDGRGMLVSIIDSGIDIAHQDLRLDPGVPLKMTPQPGWTDKVPYGWNFADDTSVVKDTGSQHGQHVAGIVAANAGTEAGKNGRINGIAPNAQLLAMKVFSNDPINGGGAGEDDIIAAIEKSVELGADVINMSLGSPNGLQEPAVGEGRAITNAVKAGVQVIVAAGNDGLNFDPKGTTTDDSGLLDNATLASPSSTPGAVSVASINNKYVMASLGHEQAGGSTFDFGFQLATGEADGKPHTIVDCGLGNPSDIPATARGNWCLIQRGAITFAAKFTNAVNAGATGVIIYNNAGESFIGMGGLDAFTIPGASVFQSVGERIKADILKNATVTLTNEKRQFPNKDAVLPSDFTSWGATAELAFKPQIAGIGGSVWSLANDNGYQTMSGTSMATPHIAGIYALGLEDYKKRYPNLSAGERGRLLEISLSNTAEILKKDGTPLAPRQIGAGLAQTDKALKSNVFATVDGQPNVALRQITAAKTFTVTVENKGTQPVTFTTGGTCVLNEVRTKGAPVSTACSNNETLTTSVPTITVPAGDKTTFTATVNPATGTNHWIEGWTTLTSNDPAQPSLAIPYMGFVGDWNAERIIDSPRFVSNDQTISKLLGTTSHSNYTMLYSHDGSSSVGRAGSMNWISPNGDGHLDDIFPALMLLRSAKEISFQICDANGKPLVDLGTERDKQRSTIAKIAAGSRVTTAAARSWDGKLYDAATDTFVPVPDGQYIYRVKARLADDMPWQTVDMPFKTDTVAPTAKITNKTKSGNGYSYTVTFDDGNGSGVSVFNVVVTDSQTGRRIPTTGLTDVRFTVPDAATGHYVRIDFKDRAGNPGVLYDFVGPAGLKFTTASALAHPINDESKDAQGNLLIKDGQITLPLVASPDVTKVTVAGKDVPMTDGKGSVVVPATEGRVQHTALGFDANGKQIASDTVTITVDRTPPTITITKAPLDAQGRLVLDSNGKALIEGKVSDNRSQPEPPPLPDGSPNVDDTLWLLDGNLSPYDINRDGTFAIEVKPEPSDQYVSLYVLDYFNPTTYDFLNLDGTRFQLAREAKVDTSTPLRIRFDEERFDGADASKNDPGQPFGDSIYVLDKTFKGLKVNGDQVTLTLSGRFNRKPGTFSIKGTPVKVDANNRFSVDLTLKEGITTVGYEVHEVDGSLITTSSWKFLYDKTAPGYELVTDPAIAEDGAVYLKAPTAPIAVSGSVWDNGFGYQMAINGSTVQNMTTIWDPGAQVNKRTFATKVQGADAQYMRLSLYDLVGNGIERTIPIISDALAPTLSVDLPAKTVAPTAKITVTANDAHLRDLKVMVDGKLVSTQLTEVVMAPGAKVVVTNTGDPNQPDVTPAAVTQPKATTFSVTPEAAKAPQTRLVYTLATPLPHGKHVLEALASDRAGNLSSTMATFVVDAAPVIGGPDAITINPDDGDLLKQIQAAFPVSDDIDQGLVVKADTAVLKLDQTVELTLTVTDSAGNTTTKVVKVLLQRPETTLTGACGSMTARFERGDTITIDCVKNPDGTTTVTVKNTKLPVTGTLTLPGLTGPVKQVDENGKVIATPSPTGAQAGALTFTSPSVAKYIIGEPIVVNPQPGNPDPTTPAPVQPEPVQPPPTLGDTGSPVSNVALVLSLVAVVGGTLLLRRRAS